jgi:CRISPR-associated protein Cas1
MKRHYFIFSNGRLVRHQNTVYLHQYEGEREDGDEQSLADAALQNGCVLEDDFAEDTDSDENSDTTTQQESNSRVTASSVDEEPILHIEQSERRVAGKRPVPIEDVEAFYLFGEMDLNTKFLNFVARHRVPLHIFNYFGFYSGTFYPRAEINSGYLLVRQVEHYSQAARRMLLARQLVEGASFNILKNLRYYGASSRGRDLSSVIAAIEAFRLQIATAKDIPTLMGVEGQIRHLYYNAWPLILTPSWAEFTRRVKRPPDNPINALISFGNSLCYTLALSEIYRTPLSPLISFLHEPGERRYSLALDIAEIFKPILCDRLIFKLVNNGELRPQHFDEKLNFCYLKENGRKIFLQAWDEKLKDTIEHRNLGRKASYRRLVRLECYRLKKHLLEIEPYEPFKIWW